MGSVVLDPRVPHLAREVAIIGRVIAGEQLTVARQSEGGVTYDVFLPDDEWLGDVSAEGERESR